MTIYNRITGEIASADSLTLQMMDEGWDTVPMMIADPIIDPVTIKVTSTGTASKTNWMLLLILAVLIYLWARL